MFAEALVYRMQNQRMDKASLSACFPTFNELFLIYNFLSFKKSVPGKFGEARPAG